MPAIALACQKVRQQGCHTYKKSFQGEYCGQGRVNTCGWTMDTRMEKQEARMIKPVPGFVTLATFEKGPIAGPSLTPTFAAGGGEGGGGGGDTSAMDPGRSYSPSPSQLLS